MNNKGLIIIIKNNEIKVAELYKSDDTYGDVGISLCNQLINIIKNKLYINFKHKIENLYFIENSDIIYDNIIDSIMNDTNIFVNNIYMMESTKINYAYIINIDSDKLILLTKYSSDYRIPLYKIDKMIATELRFIRAFNINRSLYKNFLNFIQNKGI